jgi:hypothetical protein
MGAPPQSAELFRGHPREFREHTQGRERRKWLRMPSPSEADVVLWEPHEGPGGEPGVVVSGCWGRTLGEALVVFGEWEVAAAEELLHRLVGAGGRRT